MKNEPKASMTGHVSAQGLGDFAKRSMGTYATEVNMARSVPDLFDGLKPVQRRILWASYNLRGAFVKTARLVGDVIGKYHPHGDGSAESAVTTLVQQPTPPMLGQGNWGGLLDPAAAMRYTACKLSAYGETFLHPDYINKEVSSFILNYDDTDIEPVSLPAQLPNVLINGGEGIGVGVTTCIPTFTPESIVAVLVKMLNGESLKVIDYARDLKLALRWGGVPVSSKENKQAWLNLIKTGQSSLQLKARLVIDRDKKTIDIGEWPPGLKTATFLDKVRALPETAEAYNYEGDIGFRIEMRRDYNYTQFDAYVAKVEKLARSKKAFRINVTHRQPEVVNGETRVVTKFLSLSIPKLLSLWLRERIALERRSLAYRIKKQEQAINYSKLLIFAASNLDVIFKALKAQDSKAFLMKHLKLTAENADLILDLKVRQLSKLDSDAIKLKLKEQLVFLKQLKTWLAKPRQKIVADLQQILASIAKDVQFEAKKQKKVEIL